ncbi:angiopoietin-related protein 7 [Corythoichthys intestinalis]|uniref:angiopoietin-related protein 7 n=1 Tax=Corythoichthys intestinalis TaxID=161448 RepID=UPI0025A54373|nr:angiopoietin-related protein 7 [Corythoichthys intestinalis]XP_061803596.1 angiopoietin-related protein 7-like [Nerophis lumbriciformis]
MSKVNLSIVAITILLVVGTLAQNPKKPLKQPKPSKAQCCDEVRSLKVQVANLTSLLGELSRKQEVDFMNVVKQIMDLDKQNRQQEARVTEAESKYSEINNRVEIMQLQTVQSAPQTTSDAIYDCASLYSKNYKISGEYKLPKDEFLGTPELNVFCDMKTNGGGWTLIQRRKIGLTSFNRDWKQYKSGFGSIRGDFWLGNDHIFRLTRQPSVLRIEMEDWEGETRYAEYGFFTVANELNSFRLFLAKYRGNAGDSLRYHNNTNFSTLNKDNDKCVDDCASLRKGGYWYNCCTDSNLNGVFYRYGEHMKSTDGITWYGWHGPNYSLKKVEMKVRPVNFQP